MLPLNPEPYEGPIAGLGRRYRDRLWGLIHSPLAVVQGFRLMEAGEGMADVFSLKGIQGGSCRWHVPALPAWDTGVGSIRNRSSWFPASVFKFPGLDGRPEASHPFRVHLDSNQRVSLAAVSIP